MHDAFMRRRFASTLAALGALAAAGIGPAAAGDTAAASAAASTRMAWHAYVEQRGGTLAGDRFGAAAAPILNSVRVTTTSINVASGPRPVRIDFDIESDDGVRDIFVDIRSRDFKQGKVRGVALPYPHRRGRLTVETSMFDSWSQPGSYDIRYIGICDQRNVCTSIDYYSREPVTTRSFEVSNNRAPDLTIPDVTTAEVLTPALVLGPTGGRAAVLLNLTDTLTGAAGVSVCASPASGAVEICGHWELAAHVRAGDVRLMIPFEGSEHETGEWHISVVKVVDHPGNELFEIRPIALDRMFPAGRTFTVSQ